MPSAGAASRPCQLAERTIGQRSTMRRIRSTSRDQAATATAGEGEEAHLLDQPGVARVLLQNVQANIYVADPQLRLIYMNDKATDATRGLRQDLFNTLRPQLSERVESGAPLPHDSGSLSTASRSTRGPTGSQAPTGVPPRTSSPGTTRPRRRPRSPEPTDWSSGSPRPRRSAPPSSPWRARPSRWRPAPTR